MAQTDQQYLRPKDIDNRATFRQRFVWRLETLAWDLIYWAPIKALGPDRGSNFLGWLFKKIGPLLSQHKTIHRQLPLLAVVHKKLPQTAAVVVHKKWPMTVHKK